MHLPSEQPEEAGMGHSQHKEQCDQCKQHSDDNIHLVHGQRKMVVHLFFRIHKVFVAVVEQALFSLFKVRFPACQLSLLFCQLGLTGCKAASRRASSASRSSGVWFSCAITYLLMVFLL